MILQRLIGVVLVMVGLALLFLPLVVFAQTFSGSSLEIRDEGVTQGRVQVLDVVGAGGSASVAGRVGTISLTGGGGGGAPTGYAYWGSGTDATLSAEVNLAALSTGLLINTAGTPSAYTGSTCTNQVVRLLSASGVATCQTITSAYVDSSIAVSARQILTSSPLTGGGDLTADRTISFASQLTNLVLASPNGSSGVPTFRSLVDADIPNNITIDLAAAASALAADPTDCGANQFASSIVANGNLGCTQPSFTNLSGSLALSQTSMTTARLLGRITAGTGVAEELTGTQTTTLLDTFTSALKGLAPASGGGTANFLRADGAWAAPPGGGGSLTVREVDASPSVSSVTTIEFDQGAGFIVTDQTGGVARVSSSGGGGGLSHQQVMSRVLLGF